MRYLLLILSLCVLPLMASAEQSCDTVAPGALERATKVAISSPDNLMIGDGRAVTVAWQTGSESITDTFPVYLIVSTPRPVRFGGLGFLALTKEAQGPSNIDFGRLTSRAILPLHNPTASRDGNLAIIPLRAGPLEIAWALVAATPCGERVLAKNAETVSVSPGAPRLVIQDPYDLDRPSEIVISNNQQYRLHIFPGRFRVYDVMAEVLIVEAQGHAPNFSPTGRFLASDPGAPDGLEYDVFDLEARRLIYTTVGPALVWQNGDSVLTGSADRREAIEMRQALVDDWPPSPPVETSRSESENENKVVPCDGSFETCHPSASLIADYSGCNGCGASWSEVKMAMSVDSGVAVRWVRTDSKNWEDTIYSLGFFLTEIDPKSQTEPTSSDSKRRRQLTADDFDVLDRLAPSLPQQTVGDGSTSHAPPANWRWVGSTGEKDHIPRQNAGVRELRSRLQLHQRFKNGQQEAGKSGPGTGARARGDWRNVGIATATSGARNNDLLRQQLDAVGVRLSPARVLNNLVKSVSDTGQKRAIQTSVPLVTISQPFTRHPTSKNFVDARPKCDIDQDIELHDATGSAVSQPKLLIACQDGLWAFVRDGSSYLLGQRYYPYGTHHTIYFTRAYLLLADQKGQMKTMDLGEHGANLLPNEFPRHRDVSGKDLTGNVYTVRVLAERYLALILRANGTAHIFDLETQAPLGKRINLVDAEIVQSVDLTEDARHLVQRNSDGRLVVFRMSDAQQVLSGRTIDDELLLATPDGRYEGTPEGGHFAFLSFGGDQGLHSFHQFAPRLRSPGIVRASLQGSLSPLSAKIEPPPAIDLTLLSEAVENTRIAVGASSTSGLARLRISRGIL